MPLASVQGPIGGYLAFSEALTVPTGRGEPRLSGRASWTAALVHGGVEGMGPCVIWPSAPNISYIYYLIRTLMR